MTARTRSILIVDDEAYVRAALRRALRREPYQLTEATGPREALRLLEGARFDVILSDHLMPGMTGLELLSIARSRWPDTVRIVLTGHADAGTAIDAINQGEIYRFLTKPWDDLELKVTLFTAFERLDQERENRRLLERFRGERLSAPPARRAELRDEAAAPITEEQIRLALGGSR